MQAGDDAEVGGPVEVEKLRLVVMLVEQDDGLISIAAVSLVDLGDEPEAFLV